MAKIRTIFKIALVSILPTIFLWAPFFFRLKEVWGIPLPLKGMETVVANYDGPLYIVVSKTLYNPEKLSNFEFGLPSIYYSAHFPLYPLLIKTFAPVFGFPYSMLFVTLISSVFATYFFYKFTEHIFDQKNALWLTLVFSIFPARWLIVKSVGSPEPLFIGAIIASLYYFNKERYLLSGIWGALAQLTKPPAILLFIAYSLHVFAPNFKSWATTSEMGSSFNSSLRKTATLSLIPLTLLGVFFFYKIKLNDFFAYFHSGDNIHLFFPPFQIFNYSAAWVGTFWLEEILFVYLFAVLGILKLIEKREYLLAWFVGIFFLSTIFVSHRDLIRYSLPMVPFLFVAFADSLLKKEFKIALMVLIIPIYLFSLAFISNNVMPISNWAPLL